MDSVRITFKSTMDSVRVTLKSIMDSVRVTPKSIMDTVRVTFYLVSIPRNSNLELMQSLIISKTDFDIILQGTLNATTYTCIRQQIDSVRKQEIVSWHGCAG